MGTEDRARSSSKGVSVSHSHILVLVSFTLVLILLLLIKMGLSYMMFDDSDSRSITSHLISHLLLCGLAFLGGPDGPHLMDAPGFLCEKVAFHQEQCN